jgi:hypothetical protein
LDGEARRCSDGAARFRVGEKACQKGGLRVKRRAGHSATLEIEVKAQNSEKTKK